MNVELKNRTPVATLFPGETCFYKGQSYLVLSSKRVAIDDRDPCIPLANLSKGTIRLLPSHVLVEILDLAAVEA